MLIIGEVGITFLGYVEGLLLDRLEPPSSDTLKACCWRGHSHVLRMAGDSFLYVGGLLLEKLEPPPLDALKAYLEMSGHLPWTGRILVVK